MLFGLAAKDEEEDECGNKPPGIVLGSVALELVLPWPWMYLLNILPKADPLRSLPLPCAGLLPAVDVEKLLPPELEVRAIAAIPKSLRPVEGDDAGLLLDAMSSGSS